jgi:putative ATPase
MSNGDARTLLKLLEYAAIIDKNIDCNVIDLLSQQSNSDGASEDETHYNLASAMIKSIRGSDPDAAIYYLARLINGGEEPRFIARRLLILASEDIGNANPNALVIANAAFEATSNIGYPECRIILSQLAIYLACSPKSNSAYMAINEALASIRGGEILPVLDHLKDANSAQKRQGVGKDYLYPHDFGGFVEQDYLFKPLTFVKLKEMGFEKTLTEWLSKIRSIT